MSDPVLQQIGEGFDHERSAQVPQTQRVSPTPKAPHEMLPSPIMAATLGHLRYDDL